MGLTAAHRLYTPDWPMVLVDLNEDGIRAVAADLGGNNIETVACDVSDPDAVAALADVVRDLGGVRSLAHAAGISPTMADWRRIIEVDLVGTALLVRAFEPLTSPGARPCVGRRSRVTVWRRTRRSTPRSTIRSLPICSTGSASRRATVWTRRDRVTDTRSAA